jgi:hypothetical protein
MKLARFTKGPTERKRYSIDYSDWLDTGETISAVVFAPSPLVAGGLEVDAFTISTPATSVVFFANAGINGTTYTLDVTITTSGGQIKEDQILFSVRDQ